MGAHTYAPSLQREHGKWENGGINDFVTKVFQKHCLDPPSENKMILALFRVLDYDQRMSLDQQGCLELVSKHFDQQVPLNRTIILDRCQWCSASRRDHSPRRKNHSVSTMCAWLPLQYKALGGKVVACRCR